MIPEVDIFRHYDYIEPWRQLTKKNLKVVHLPGDHFNMLEDPALPISVENVRAILAARGDESRRSLVA